ncbi:replication restart helicase PriA [Sulfobacillus harzensis]|uniref:Replication restart protein PriA n=1 Tax=Sulfobacillus harzensis TaxID=2729629 RepID=A0A7Y0L3S9_9FIRM|nr:primosomal protein N' [Sulfobacillus harzensis]NMP22402.1 primosomal protein N' [Sulfobacillus harzensis]
MAILAEVVIDQVAPGLDRPFTYVVPDTFEEQVALGQWVEVPFGSRVLHGVITQLAAGDPAEGTKAIHAIVDRKPVVTPVLLEMAQWLSGRYLCYVSQALRSMVPASVRRRQSARPKMVWYRVVGARSGRPSTKQAMFEFVRDHGPVDRRTLLDQFNNAQQALRALVAEEALEVLTDPPQSPLPQEALHQLTAAQQAVLQTMESEPGRAWLLEGVTGSGKTEVYLALIEARVAAGRQALVLLPEIALTPQVLLRFRERFGTRVAVWHSGLGHGERRLIWEAVRDGRVSVVVGARSAVFLPFPRLGAIVVDEEHEPSYKQEEHPRYHAREAALWRGKREGVTVVLGSATPSVETRFWAEQGAIGHLRLPERAMGRSLPAVELVDMREELQKGNRQMFSHALTTALDEVLRRGEQAILFLNRRGYSTFVLCRACGQALQCPDCAVSLTYHQRDNRLVCHYCLKEQPLPKRCPECGSDKIRYFGAGTERVADEVGRLFPGTRVIRADRDTLTRPDDYAELYQNFLSGQADVLVGTQMIAKGMDFPRVTLVGVVAADTALHLPDYRAAERTFQLLVQAGGRSGRGDQAGRVVIQTYNPDHYAIFHAYRHDYAAFYQEEISFREQAHYPPYSDLWLLVLEGSEESDVKARADGVYRDLRAVWPNGEILGPAPAPLARIRGQYRYHLLLKSTHNDDLAVVLRTLQSQHRGVSITRDPYFLM